MSDVPQSRRPSIMNISLSSDHDSANFNIPGLSDDIDLMSPGVSSDQNRGIMKLDKASVLCELNEMISVFTLSLCNRDVTAINAHVNVSVTLNTAERFVSALASTMAMITSQHVKPENEAIPIIPLEVLEPESLTEAAALLDANKIRLLLSISSITAKDVESYARLLMAEQNEYKRKHLLITKTITSSNGVYTPSDKDALMFVEDNNVISKIFVNNLIRSEYFHALRAFTHESFTNGRTSSQLLASLGKNALRTEILKLAYNNGETYGNAKQTFNRNMNDEIVYKKAISMSLQNYILVGNNCCSFDKDIVIQTVFAIFGVFYFVKGISGLHDLNNIIEWKNTLYRFW